MTTEQIKVNRGRRWKVIGALSSILGIILAATGKEPGAFLLFGGIAVFVVGRFME